MKKGFYLLVVAMLAVGISGCSSPEEGHKEEYLHHVSQLWQDIDFAQHGIGIVSNEWEKRTPQEVVGALNSANKALVLTSSESTDMQYYLKDHDDTDSNGNTSFFSYLFQYYQEALEKRIEETWKYTHIDVPIPQQPDQEFWKKLEQDLMIMEKDFEILKKMDQRIFMDGEMSEMREYFVKQVELLQFEEVLKQYHKYN